MNGRPLTVAWFSYFPVEWLAAAPPEIRGLPKRHPAPWLQSCASELSRMPGARLHAIELRKGIQRDITFELEGVTYHCLKVPGGWRAPSMFWLDTYLIRRRLRQIQPDVVHAWGTEMGAALVATRLRYPSLISVQGLMEYYGEHGGLSTYQKFIVRFERQALRRAAVVSGESTFVVNWLRRKYPHLELHHVEHSPDASFCQVVRQPETRPLRFLYVGQMSFRKGSDLLLLALDKLRNELDFTLTLVEVAPEPKMLAVLKERTSSALWERVRFVRAARSPQVAEQLSRTAMVLFPTRADTGPVAVKEAVVAGVPVVGSTVGGIPDYIEPGKNGILFPPDDLDKFVGAIREACAHPLLGKGIVVPSALAEVRNHLSPSRMAQGFAGIYRQLQERAKS